MSVQSEASYKHSGSDHLERERELQRQEFLRREKKPNSQKPLSKKTTRKKKRGQSLDHQLDQTFQWLEETFPRLFAADDYLPLSDLILRDLKQDYKTNQAKKNYPPNLILRAAIFRYKSSPGYLYCLKEGLPKYALDGSVSGYVTHEEVVLAQQVLEKQ